MPLIILLLIGLMFYFGPGVPILIGLTIIGAYLLLVAAASAVIYRLFGPPRKCN